MKRYILDTDFLIRVHRRDPLAIIAFANLKPTQRTYSVITYLEFVAGEAAQGRTAKDARTIDAIFAGGEILGLTPSAAQNAARWALQFGFGKKRMNDLAIAATSKELKRELVTFNTKDFQMLNGVRLAKIELL